MQKTAKNIISKGLLLLAIAGLLSACGPSFKTTVRQDLTGLNDRLAAVERTTGEHSTTIGGHTQVLGAHTLTLTTLTETAAAHTEAITRNTQSIRSLTGRVTANEGRLTALEEARKDLDGARRILAGLATRTTSMEDRTEYGEDVEVEYVYFGLGSATLDPDDEQVLLDLVARAATRDLTHCTVVGYSDEKGTETARKSVARQRANIIKAFMADHGIDVSTVTIEVVDSTSRLDPLNAANNRCGAIYHNPKP